MDFFGNPNHQILESVLNHLIGFVSFLDFTFGTRLSASDATGFSSVRVNQVEPIENRVL